MSIGHKIKIAFGITIAAFVGEILLTQFISSRSEKSFLDLKENVIPGLEVVENFKVITTELKLLLYSKINNNNFQYNNRIKSIIDVEIPILKTDISILKEEDNPSLGIHEKMVLLKENADQLENASRQVMRLLITAKSYQNRDIHDKSLKLFYDAIEPSSTTINLTLNQLQIHFAGKMHRGQAEISAKLKETSKIVMVTGIIGILLVLFITSQTVKAITIPIQKLISTTKKVSAGDFSVRASINTQDEFYELGQNFDLMTMSLEQSFNDIKEKNQELEQFTYVASHDLQEPLITISSMAHLIQKSYANAGDEKLKKTVAYMSNASMRMGSLIQGLLQYSQIGSKGGDLPVNLSSMMLEIKEELSLILKHKKASIQIPDLPEIRGFGKEVKELFTHLIMNGIEFSREGVNPEIELIVSDKGNYWQFGVKDNGIGIAQHHKERIFMIFQRLQTRDINDNIGLGLAYCRKIIQLHRGKLWVESELNLGSTFYFTLPK